MTFGGKPHDVTQPGHVSGGWKEVLGSLCKWQWLRRRECTENIPTSQLWAPERVLPHLTLLSCGPIASCPHIFMIPTVSDRNSTQTCCLPLWFGPKCLQNWIRSYRNLELGTKAGSKYARIPSLSICLSSLHVGLTLSCCRWEKRCHDQPSLGSTSMTTKAMWFGRESVSQRRCGCQTDQHQESTTNG